MKKVIIYLIFLFLAFLVGCKKETEPTLQFESTTITIELMETFTLTPITNQNLDQITYVIGDSNLLTRDENTFQGVQSGEVMIVASLINYPQIKRYILVQIVSFQEEYTIIYDLNGGALPISQVSTIYSEYTLPMTLPLPIKEDFTFAGWHLEEDFSDTGMLVLPSGTTNNIILYAKWE